MKDGETAKRPALCCTLERGPTQVRLEALVDELYPAVDEKAAESLSPPAAVEVA